MECIMKGCNEKRYSRGLCLLHGGLINKFKGDNLNILYKDYVSYGVFKQS